jgi:signal transduction histidine kinase
MPEARTPRIAERLDRLTATSRAVSYESPLEEVLDVSLESAASLLGIDRIVALLQEPGGGLRILAVHCLSAEDAARFRADLDETLFDRLREILRPEQDQQLVGAPIMAAGKVVGLLAMPVGPGGHDERDQWILAALADQVSVAVSHARHEATNQDLTRRLAELQAQGQRQESALHVVRHDLSTPVGAILGYIDLFQRGAYGRLSASQRAALGRINVAATHLQAVMENALEMGRLQSGRVSVSLGAVSVATAIDEAIAIVQLRAHGADTRLKAEVPSALDVLADRAMLRQVLVHLLDNAIKFGGTGSEVLVSAGIEADSRSVVIRVSDGGPGVAAEVTDEIFMPYKSYGGGTGLGLAIARAVLDLMGGEIGLADGGGSGATFFVRLPRA